MSDLPAIEELAKTVSMLSADAVQRANSGHPGLPMGAAGYASLLWAQFLRFNPQEPRWLNRDRFVLSAGHGSALLYSLLHLFGYELSLEELQSFRQWGSSTPGHPEFGVTAGVECTTGPLGQGVANGVGLALSGKLLAAEYGSALFDYRVYGIVSDGDLMEGIASEACSLAGHLGLGNLIYLYDDNKISLAGSTDVCFTESVQQRMESYGWHVQSVDAQDLAGVKRAIENAIEETAKPSIIAVRSIIGYGSPNKANTYGVHGSPLGDAELSLTKKGFEWPSSPAFYVPEGVSNFCKEVISRGVAEHSRWSTKYAEWRDSHPSLAGRLDAQVERRLPEALRDELLGGLGHTKDEATRSLSGKAIQIMAKHLSQFIGGSADLEPSTKTLIKDTTEIQKGEFAGRNIRFGVREHAMGAVVNGLAYERLWYPFGSTFLVFSDYLRPAIRIAALSHLQSLFIFTHDSFWVGEDGPTHEPIEQLQSLRLIPNLYTFRPADGLEVGACYWAALESRDQPSALIFTRQDLPALVRSESFSAEEVLRGGYVLESDPAPQFVIIATGSEVALAVDAAKILRKSGIQLQIVSMPCVELFLEQPITERNAVVPPKLPVVTIEAGRTLGWERFTGRDGLAIGIDHYGASAPGEVLAEKFGFTPELIVEKITTWLNTLRK
jgi:transketolase